MIEYAETTESLLTLGCIKRKNTIKSFIRIHIKTFVQVFKRCISFTLYAFNRIPPRGFRWINYRYNTSIQKNYKLVSSNVLSYLFSINFHGPIWIVLVTLLRFNEGRFVRITFEKSYKIKTRSITINWI